MSKALFQLYSKTWTKKLKYSRSAHTSPWLDLPRIFLATSKDLIEVQGKGKGQYL